MIIPEDCYVSLTRDGYIKKISERSYKASENTAFGKKDNDYLVALTKANTLDTLLAFTDAGNYCFIPVHKIEDFKWKDLGKHISYLVKMGNDEKIISTLLVKDFHTPIYVVLASDNGMIKRVLLQDFEVSRYTKTYKAINIKAPHKLVGVAYTNGQEGLVLGSRAGYATLFSESEVSILSPKASGVKAMNLKNDTLAFMQAFDPAHTQSLYIFTKPAGLKRLHISDIPATKRGAKGIIIAKKPKTKEQDVIAGYVLDNDDQLTIYSESNSINLSPTDYNYANTSNRMSTIKGLEEDISFIYNPEVKATDTIDLKEEGDDLINMEVKQEPNLFDLPEEEHEKKVVKKAKKEQHFEPISLEDLLDDDAF